MTSIIKVDQIQSSSGTGGLSIDSNGIISNSVSVYARASHSVTTSNGNLLALNHGQEQNGGVSFVDSNTAMQVPVAGVYMVGFHALGNTSSGSLTIKLQKNGSDLTASGNYIQDTNASNDGVSFTTVTTLAANDKIQFYVQSGASHGNASYNNFFCAKIG